MKHKPESVHFKDTGNKAVSISHSMGQLAWHTDAAFKKNPTGFSEFHIIHPDKQGGGVFRFPKAEGLSRLLSPQTVDVGSRYESDLKVPPEVFKGKNTVKGKLLEVDAAT